MMQSLCHLDLTTVQKLAVDRILCQSGTDLFRERTVGEHDLPGYFIQPGRSGSFEENPYHIISYKHFFKTVLRTLQAGFDFFLSFSAQIMILAIELNIIEIFAGHGSDGDIVPAVALYSLAQLPTEFTSEMREGSLQIFEMENGEYHTPRTVAALSFNFLPHDSADADIRHEDDIRQIF